MSDLDVSLRLRLVNDLSKEAKKAAEDLKKLEREVKDLGKGNTNHLDRELSDVGRKAKESASAVRTLERDINKLGGVNANKAEAEIKSIGTAAKVSMGEVDTFVSQANSRLSTINTNTAEAEIKEIGQATATAEQKIAAFTSEANARLAGINTNTAEAEIREIGQATTTAEQKIASFAADANAKLATIDGNAAEAKIKEIGQAVSPVEQAIARMVGEVNGKLGTISADSANREVRNIGNAGKFAGRTIGEMVAEANAKLDTIKGDKAAREVKNIGTAAKFVGRTIGELVTEANNKLATINMSPAEQKFKQLGEEAAQARARIDREMSAAMKKLNSMDPRDRLFNNLRHVGEIEAPASRLGGIMAFLQQSAVGAFAGLLAFASVDNIVRGLDQLAEKARKLNREIASVAVTAEQRDPETMKKVSRSNEKLSLKYGLDQTAVNDARKTFVAAGVGIDDQEAVLDPTLAAAKASDSSGETIASTVVALQQNLGVKNSEVKAALDMMAGGAKFGSFELKDMAKDFPTLATMYSNTGRSGLDATAELVAAAEVVRRGAGTPDEAANNLRNLMAKLTSSDTVDHFKDKHVDLEALKKKSAAEGKPYMMAVVDEVMRLTKGNPFKINELFGDRQAADALAPLINNRELYNQWVKAIRSGSGGMVGKDWDFLKNLPQERADRRDAAFDATGMKWGDRAYKFVEPLLDLVARSTNTDFEKQRRQEELPGEIAGIGLKKLEAENRILELQQQKRTRKDPTHALDPKIFRLQSYLRKLEAQEALLVEEQNRLDKEMAPAPIDDGDLGKSTGKVPVPLSRPRRDSDLGKSTGNIAVPKDRPAIEDIKPVKIDFKIDQSAASRASNEADQVRQNLGKDMSPAAAQSMDGFIAKLGAELNKAVALATSAAGKMKAALSFTASPTVTPSFAPPKGQTTTTTTDKHASINNTSNTGVKLTQNINTRDARLAANRALRDQNRAVRMAQARALGDLGPRTA